MVTRKHERQQDLWQAAIEKKENAVVIREFDVICSRTHTNCGNRMPSFAKYKYLSPGSDIIYIIMTQSGEPQTISFWLTEAFKN